MSNFKLPRSSPEEQGVLSSGILDFIKAVEADAESRPNQELHSFMLLRHGQVIAEGCWAPYDFENQHMLFSLSKSFTSTAIGFAVEEGLFTLEDTLVSFFPEYVPENASENLSSMCIRHLLSMSTGHAEDTTGHIVAQKEGDWAKAFFELPVEYKPGTHFLYNTGATYMLSAIIQRVTGQKLIDYLKTRLFEPLGIEKASWEECPKGINTGGFGLKVKTEDIAKFGQLYLQKGMWQERRILPVEWVQEATRSQIWNGDEVNNDWSQGYGFQFWRCRHNAYRGDGAFGQYCVVMPDQDCVIAITSGLSDMQAVLNHIWKHLLPAIKDTRLEADAEASEELKKKQTTLEYCAAKGSDYSSAAEGLSQKKYQLEKNDANFDNISFVFEKNTCQINIFSGEKLHTINCGVGSCIRNDINLNGVLEPAAASGAWISDNTFKAIIRYIETPIVNTAECCFNNDL